MIIAHFRGYFKVWIQVALSPSGTCNNPSEKHYWSIILILWNITYFKRKSCRSVLLLGDIHMAAKSLQSCLTLCDPIDGSPPGSSVPEILQARTLEWVAISFSNVWKWKVKVKSLSCVRPLATPWTAAYQAPLSMGYMWQRMNKI